MTMKQEKKRIYLRAALALAALLVVLLALDNLSFVPSMLLTVLRKGAIYALVAVSMNLLNGCWVPTPTPSSPFPPLRRSPSISAMQTAASASPSRNCSPNLWAASACCWVLCSA